MKFFYALMLFMISTVLFFYLYIFLVPSPKLYLAGDNNVSEKVNETNVIVRQALEISKIEDKGQFYFFDINLSEKRPNAVFLYMLLTTACLFTAFLLFHAKTYIFFPLAASLIFCATLCTILWLFTNSISKNIYLDLQSIRVLENLAYMRLLGLFLFMETILFIFGFWYKFPKE